MNNNGEKFLHVVFIEEFVRVLNDWELPAMLQSRWHDNEDEIRRFEVRKSSEVLKICYVLDYLRSQVVVKIYFLISFRFIKENQRKSRKQLSKLIVAVNMFDSIITEEKIFIKLLLFAFRNDYQ